MNPEFRRNLWLEFTPQRLVIMPIILGLIFFAVDKVEDHRGEILSSVRAVRVFSDRAALGLLSCRGQPGR